MYETLLTKEEYVKAIDMGSFFRIPIDQRDLNYSNYFADGNVKLAASDEYNSNNTVRLTVEQVKEKLMALQYINDELGAWGGKA